MAGDILFGESLGGRLELADVFLVCDELWRLATELILAGQILQKYELLKLRYFLVEHWKEGAVVVEGESNRSNEYLWS